MDNHLIAESLKNLLADTYSLYLKTQNYHWNVTGPSFKTLHLLFEEQYTDLSIAVDNIAERIRALGEKAPGTFKKYQEVTKIKDGNENASSVHMVKDLAGDQNILVETLQEVLKIAQDHNDEATIGIVVDRIGVHQKAAWMLNSSV